MGQSIKIGKHKINRVNQLRKLNLIKKNDEVLNKFKNKNCCT